MQLLTILAPGTAFEMTGTEALLFGLLGLTLVLLVAVLLLAITTIRVLGENADADARRHAEAAGTYVPSAPRLGFWEELDRKFITNAVPLEREKDIVLDHDYDGIHELDNHLPPWWTGLFYATIAFAVVYLLVFHVWKQAPLQAEELAIEQQQAQVAIAAYQAKATDAIDETNVTLAKEDKVLADGKSIYDQNCKVCHGAEGQGGVGPNMTDDYWIHGGGIKNVFKVIKQGVPQKGMISWKATLKPGEMRAVASFILAKLQGTTPAGAKEPQGTKYVPEGGAAAPADTAAADTSTATAAAPAAAVAQ
jgi:cytochrome c oxidase cbb3-type subunit 3